VIRVLSIDGGGIRGLIPAVVCEKWEEWSGSRLHQLFDLMVGTSTGGLLAMGLSIPPNGKSAADVVSFYTKDGPKIFGDARGLMRYFSRAKYESDPLLEAVTRVFGDIRMSDALVELLVTTYDVKNCTPMYLRKRSQGDANYLMREVAMATSAAPTYFPPAAQWDRVLVDGGMVANNPANLAFAEAKRLWPDEEVFLVSLGTGTLSQPETRRDVGARGSFAWAERVIDIMFDGSSRATHDVFRYSHGDKYRRFQVGLSEHTKALDNASEKSLLGLRKLGEDLARDRERELLDIAELLKSTGPLRGTIETPKPNHVVSVGECRVRGTVTGYSDEKLYLLTGKGGRYWPSERLTPKAGGWEGVVYFGTGVPEATIAIVAADVALSEYIEFYRAHRVELKHPGIAITSGFRRLHSLPVFVDRSNV
jgi:uncharacterized protein